MQQYTGRQVKTAGTRQVLSAGRGGSRRNACGRNAYGRGAQENLRREKSQGSAHRSKAAGTAYSHGKRGRRSRWPRRNPVLMVLLGAAVVAAALFAFNRIRYQRGVKKYTECYLPGTTINGIDVGDKTPAEAAEELTFTMPDVSIELQDGSTQKFSLSDVGGSYDYTKELKEILSEQDPSKWQEEDGKDYMNISPDLSYDESKVRSVVMQIPAVTDENATDPTDAYIAKTDSGFEIVPEQIGTKLDADKLVAAVEASLKKWNYTIDATDCYEQPAIKASDLSLTDTEQAITNLDMLYVNMSGGKSATIDKATIMDWVVWDEASNSVSLDLSKVLAKTQELAQEYNTLGTVRTFTTHDGNTIQIGGSAKDTFGYKMDVQTTASRIQNCILTGTREAWAKWPVAGNTRTDTNDFGNTYVEVSIQEQHLWYYVNGSVVLETDVVTGAGANSTTPGVFMILDKQSPADLKGDGYVTHVSYWMPVTYTGTGLHDATWRTEFGKEIYVSGGSHGCVNMPLDVVAELYGQIDMGTPVIIY